MSKRAIYELRTYVLKPTKIADYIKLTNSKFHLRTSHSILNGFWFHELGGKLNAATHIWEYENLSARAQVRANLGGDSGWISEYVKDLLPCLESQENKVCVIPDWAEGISDFSNEKAQAKQKDGSGIFELVSIKKSSKNANPESIKNIVQKILADNDKIDFTGCLETVLGENGEYVLLFRHENVDSTLDNAGVFCDEQKSTVMLPAAWSPMK